MSKLPLTDAKAREAIRMQLNRNFLVEAGAGSGKTTSLVERMVALVGSGSCRIDGLAAVTFTRKAAGELRERFQVKLEQACREATDPTVKERLIGALEQLDRAFIGTIHSFCGRLLRERPVEAGVDPEFTEVEGMEEKLLEERAWEEYLLQVWLSAPQLLETLDRLDVSPKDLKETYHRLVLYPDVEMVVQEAPYPDLDPARRDLERLCRLAEVRLPEDAPQGGWDDLQELLRAALRWRRVFDLSDDRYLLRLLQRMDKKPKPVLKRWPEKEYAREVETAFNQFKETIIAPVLQCWQEYRHPYLMEFLAPAARCCRELRQRESALNFQDLLMHAAELLRDNPEVRGYFQSRYTHLLVDEFQDTDPIQAEVVLYLAGAERDEPDWTRLTPRPGALFVVGDPKQSIYRFRRADIDIYNRVKEQIRSAGGELLYLTTNFRSLPELLNWTNPAFADLFAASSSPYQAEFVPMDQIRRRHLGAGGGPMVQQLEVETRRQDEVVREDARRIAAWIQWACRGNLQLSRERRDGEPISVCPEAADFLILLRYKKDMALYARALESVRIPFTISGGSDIGGSLELWELLYLLQTLTDPDNPVPLAAYLRGAFCGVSDDELYRFKLAGGEFNFLRNIPEGVEPVVGALFESIWERLRRFRDWSREMPPSAALERIITELGMLPLALSGSMGRGKAGYLLQALELIRRIEQEGQTAFASAVDFFARLLESGMEEELDLEGGKFAGVRIMNLHKAKGLEAPIVILANPSRSPGIKPDLHISRAGREALGYCLIQRSKGHRYETLGCPPDWDRRQEEEERYHEAEEMRLLYVAATRAKDLLLVSTYPQKAQASPWVLLERYLGNAPLLELPDILLPGTSAPGEPVTPERLSEAVAAIRADLDRLAAPTYRCEAVSELAKAPLSLPRRSQTGRGVTWGNAVHSALETLARQGGQTDLAELAAALLKREGRAPEERETLTQLLRRVTEQPFWRRVTAAAEVLPEVPFGFREGERYLTGTIDLVFLEEGGWVLVDYKSDAVQDPAHLAELIEYYRPQLECYRAFWSTVTGAPVRECGLFFTDVLEYILVSSQGSSH